MDYNTDFLKYVYHGQTESGKTNIYKVYGRSSDALLGLVKWYGAWRKYCFYPEPYTMFDTHCLQEISKFCLERTNDR